MYNFDSINEALDEGAIERLDSYDAVLHYNKHISPSHQNKIDPNFVISVISHVEPYSFSSDSSDEEADSEFKREFEECKREHGENAFKYSTTKRHSTTKTINHDGQFISQRKNKIENFLNKLSENGWEGQDASNKSRLRVSVALNRMKSLSSRKNQSLRMELKRINELPCEKFTIFWHCQWFDHKGSNANYDDVRRYYKKLKNYNKRLAMTFLEREEDMFEKDRRNIPYGKLREDAKNYKKTQELVQDFRKENPNCFTYLCIMDDDVHDFNGIFSAYVRIFQGCYQAPTVMTTGYEYPLDPDFGQAYQLLSRLDRMIRVITTFYIPLGTYYPEPNLCILIPNDLPMIPESFIDERRGRCLESPILLTEIQKQRPNAIYIFSEDRPLITSISTRAKENIGFSEEFASGWANPSCDDIKKLKTVSQSSARPFIWYKNLFINGSVALRRNYDADDYCYSKKGTLLSVNQQCVKIISKLVKHKSDNSLRNALKLRMMYPEDEEKIYQVIVARENYINKFELEHQRTEEEQQLCDIFRKYDIEPTDMTLEKTLTLASRPFLTFIEETLEEALKEIPKKTKKLIKKLVKLNAEILRFLLALLIEGTDVEVIMDLFKLEEETLEDLSNVDDRDHLIFLLKEYSDEFFRAKDKDYFVEDIVKLHKENPLHLDFMSCYDATEYVYENSDDEEIVSFALEYYVNDIDIDWIRSELSETERMHFDLHVDNYYGSEGEGESVAEDNDYN